VQRRRRVASAVSRGRAHLLARSGETRLINKVQSGADPGELAGHLGVVRREK